MNVCGRPHGADQPPPPCERHKWMAPNTVKVSILHAPPSQIGYKE